MQKIIKTIFRFSIILDTSFKDNVIVTGEGSVDIARVHQVDQTIGSLIKVVI
jgi:hypothetical protein